MTGSGATRRTPGSSLRKASEAWYAARTDCLTRTLTSASARSPFTERVNTKFAADLFNVSNHPNFANPSQTNLNVTNPNTFGTIYSSYTPRIVHDGFSCRSGMSSSS